MNSTESERPSSQAFLITFAVIESLFAITGVLGNLFVIVYNVFLNVDKNATSYFVLNLAVSDLLVCGIFFPTYATETTKTALGIASGSNLMCQITLTITGLSLAVSVANIMVLTIDRYISITLPLRYPNIVTTRRTYVVLVAVWCVGFINGGFTFASTKSTGIPLVCEVDMIFVLAGSSFCFLIPLSVTVAFNFKILQIVRAQRRKIAVQATPSDSSGTEGFSARRHLAKQFKLFKTFIVVFGCFLFCVTPFPILAVVEFVVCGGGCVPFEVLGTFAMLAGANSLINAFIYGVRHEEYQRAFKILLSKPCSAF